MNKVISIFLLMLLPLSVNAKVGINGIYYELNNETNEAQVLESEFKLSGDFEIPSTVTYSGKNYNVTSISDAAFYRSELSSISIPSSVKTIGAHAFRECRYLKSVNISDGVTTIGDCAFMDSGLTSVTIPNSVTEIGQQAFHYCVNLSSVTISNSVTTIKEETFIGCNLSSIIIPNSVTVIEKRAFVSPKLTSITIPNSVTKIGEDAFLDCYNLSAVYITDLAAWCKINFESHYSNPLYQAYNLYLNNDLIRNLIIPNNVTEIADRAFVKCKLISLTIPNSVKTIGRSAFEYCSGLTSLSIPNSVTTIGILAFSDCSGLTSVSIPNSVTTIGGGAFSDCSGLTSVSIPNSVTTIDEYAFYNCSGLTAISIGDGIEYIGFEAFAGNKITDVYCFAVRSPKTNSDAFSHPDYITLHVPAEGVEQYRDVEPWMYFKDVVALTHRDYTNITTGTSINDKKDVYVFDIKGNKLEEPRKGLNIIRTKDGKAKKVLMK